MFGYSLSFLNDSLLVGVPRLNTSQPDITEAGGVYICNTKADLQCSPLNIDTYGNNIGEHT